MRANKIKIKIKSGCANVVICEDLFWVVMYGNKKNLIIKKKIFIYRHNA